MGKPVVIFIFLSINSEQLGHVYGYYGNFFILVNNQQMAIEPTERNYVVWGPDCALARFDNIFFFFFLF